MTSSSRPGATRIARDVRHEAVAVLAGDQRFEFGLLGGHRASQPRARAVAPPVRVRSGVANGASRRTSSSRLTSTSARRIARLMRCQPCPTRQVVSMSQLPAPPAHSVSASGPSTASMISAALIERGRAGELVAAVRAADRGHEARVLEFLQELADGRQADPRALGDVGGAREAAVREAREDHRRVIGQSADAQHGTRSGGPELNSTILVLLTVRR